MSWRTLLLALACLHSAWLTGAGLAGARQARADEYGGLIELDPPGPREFVRDLAHLLRPSDEQKIKQLAEQLLTDKKTPIIVVTINSMAEHGGARMRIDTFALLLFNQWGVGSAQLNGEDWNTGILLLVSKGDRKARIELGRYWRRENDLQCHQIMDQTIIPKFKSGDFSGGILSGVEALDKMARGLQLPHAAAAIATRHPTIQQPKPQPRVVPPEVNRPFSQPPAPPITYHYAPIPRQSPSLIPFFVLLVVIGVITLLVALLAGTTIFNAHRRFRSGMFGNDYFGSGPFFPWNSGYGSHWYGNSPFGHSGSDFGGSHTSGGSFSSGSDFGGGGGSFGGSSGGSSGGAFDGGSSGGGGATGSW